MIIRSQSLVRQGLVDPTSLDDPVRCIFDADYTIGFRTCKNQIRIAFPELDLSNFSFEGDTEPSTFQCRSRGVEIHELDPDSAEIYEEVSDEASKAKTNCDPM